MKLHILRGLSVEEAVETLNQLFKRHALVIVLGRCSVYYEGRSASKLGEGDRLVIVKPDGAVLVHRPTGYSPVNWQPDSKVVVAENVDGKLVIRSVRERPREILEIMFTSIELLVGVESMNDQAEFVMYLDEHEIRDYLARHPELIEPGLRVISVERPVEPGFVDLYGVDSKGNIVVVEIKRGTAGKDAVLQLKRYIEAFRKHNPRAPVRGILVAPSISKQALQLLNSLGLEYKRISVDKIFAEIRREKETAKAKTLLSFLYGAGGVSRSSRSRSS